MRSRSWSISLAFLALSGVLVSDLAGAVDVIVDYDPQVEFFHFRTLGWLAGTPAEDPEVERRIRVAVERELVGAGFKEVREDPDILVITHAAIENQELIDLSGYDYWQSFVGRKSTASDEKIWGTETGTILVDILDPKTERLIWRGVAREVVDKKPEKRDLKINRAVAKMFRGFPPKWKAENSDAEKTD